MKRECSLIGKHDNWHNPRQSQGKINTIIPCNEIQCLTVFNLAILDAQHAWQNRDLAFVQDKNGIHIFFDSKHKDRPWWLKRKRICKNCINFYSSQTNLFVIQIDVNSSLIYYVSVVRGTHKNVCVPWSKNTSPGSINTLLDPVLWITCVIDQKGEVSLGLSPDQVTLIIFLKWYYDQIFVLWFFVSII